MSLPPEGDAFREEEWPRNFQPLDLSSTSGGLWEGEARRPPSASPWGRPSAESPQDLNTTRTPAPGAVHSLPSFFSCHFCDAITRSGLGLE
jgi:hypothetical protein